jgi:hypothetical protein
MFLLRWAPLSSCASSSAAALLLSRTDLLNVPCRAPAAACQNLSTSIDLPSAADTTTTSSSSNSSSSPSTPLPAHADAALLRAEEQQQNRRGFGGKVSLPAEDVLNQVVLAAGAEGGPVELTLRSYHVGEF